VGKMEEYGENRREGDGVAAKRAASVGLALPRCAGASDRILPHRDRHGSAGSFSGLAHALARFWGPRCGPFLGPEPKIRAGLIFGALVEMPLHVASFGMVRFGNSD
jgi:hypothetical protein